MFSPQQSYWLVVDIMSFVPLGTITTKNTSNDNCYIGDFSYHVFFPMEPVLYRENRTTYVFSDQPGEISSPVFSPRPNAFFPTLGKSHIICFSRSYRFLRSIRRNLIVCVFPETISFLRHIGKFSFHVFFPKLPVPSIILEKSHRLCFLRDRLLCSPHRGILFDQPGEISSSVFYPSTSPLFPAFDVWENLILCVFPDTLHCFPHLISGKISSTVFSPRHIMR